MGAQAAVKSEPALTTEVNYAGHIQGRPVFDFFDGSKTNLPLQTVSVPVVNLRTQAEQPQLEREGFALIPHKTSVNLDQSREEIERVYFDEVKAKLLEVTGAAACIPFRRGLLIRRPNAMRGTRVAHFDYTRRSAEEWLGVERYQQQFDPGLYRRMAIYQTWRLMSPPPQEETLLLCDARTSTAEDGIVFSSIISANPGETFETRVLKANPKHRWYFWNDLQPDELIVFKGYDSDPHCISDVGHQAATNPLGGPRPVARESIEARFYLFFR